MKYSSDDTAEELQQPRKRRRLDGESKDSHQEILENALSIYDGENAEFEDEGFLMLDDNDTDVYRPLAFQGHGVPVQSDAASSSSTGHEQPPRAPQPGKCASADLLDTEPLHCPICNKIETTNRGLNEHIDFCLSRGAIREAQAVVDAGDTNVHVGKDRKNSGGPSHKPPSSKGKQNGKKGASNTSGQGLLRWAKKDTIRKAS